MLQDLSPDYIRPLEPGEKFQFRCHPAVDCFNECCRNLELALTPYDVLRLKGALGLSSGEFLERHALIEQPEDSAWPLVYLGMVDDGRGSCPFVSPAGCRVYAHRPGACRMYPLGRGVRRNAAGRRQDLYLLLTEPHCRGFAGPTASWSIGEWLGDQELIIYNALNDALVFNLEQERLDRGAWPDAAQREKVLLALYNLDEFKKRVLAAELKPAFTVSARERERMAADELYLLRFAHRWLRMELFEG
jgi:uncharacterized protein